MSRTQLDFSRGLALMIVLLGFALRVHDLGAKSLWYDELRQVEVAQKPLAEWDAALLLHAARPLDYLITRAMLGLSRSEWLLRFPALIWGTLTMPLVYRLGARLFGSAEGLIGAYLLALSSLAISFAQELRPYALYGLMSAVSFLALDRGLTRGAPRAWAMYALSLVVGVLTHYFWLAIMLGQAAHVLGAAAVRQLPARRLPPFLAALAAGLAVLLIHPGPVVLLPIAGNLVAAMLARVDVAAVPVVSFTTVGFNPFAPTLTYDFFVGRVLEQLGAGGGAALVVFNGLLLVGVVGSLGGVGRLRVGGSRPPRPALRASGVAGESAHTESPISNLSSPSRGIRRLLFLLTWLFVGPAFLVAYLMYRNEIFAMRYILFALPPYLLLVARGLVIVCRWMAFGETENGTSASVSAFPFRIRWKSAVLAILILITFTLLDARYLAAYYRTPKDDWRRVGSFLAANVRPGDAIVAPNAQAFVEFYFPGARTYLVYSDTKREAQVAYGQHERTWFVVTNWVTYDIGDTKRLIELYPGVTVQWDESSFVKFTHRGLSEVEMQAEAAQFLMPPPSLRPAR